MNNAKRARLTDGPIASTLARLTGPMIIGILGMVAFNLVDTFFVGQLGTSQLAALSFTFPVVFMISSIAIGIGIGAAAVISRAIGHGDQDQVQRFTTDSLFLAVILVGVALIIGLLTIEPVFRLLGATEQTLPYIREYMTIWYGGIIFLVIPMVGNSAIRATGDTKTPSLVMLVAVGVNIILDPLLIFGIGPFPQMGVAGAATATVISRAVTFLVAVWVLYYRDQMITLVVPPLRTLLNSWRRILYIGVPAAGTKMIVPLGTAVITRLVSGYGEEAVAAYGVSARVEIFSLVLVLALSTALAPFVGQNFGAARMERVRTGVGYAQQFAVASGIVAALLLAVIARPLASLFNSDPAVIDLIVLYLRIVPIGYALQGVLQLSNDTLNVLNKPLHASALMVVQMFALYIPLALLGSSLVGVAGIFVAAATANVLAGLAAYLWLRRVLGIEKRASMAALGVPAGD